MHFLSFLALAAPLVSAIQFVDPVANVTLSKGQTYSVKWDSVDTDPTTFSIYLVNFVNWPPFYTQIAYDVPTSEGEHEVTVPCNVDSSWGFQFNAINGTNVYVIHAQTPKFFVTDGPCSGSAPPPVSNGPSPACTAVTVSQIPTTTVTVTASATDLAPASCTATATVTVTGVPAQTTSASTTTLATVSPAASNQKSSATSVSTLASAQPVNSLTVSSPAQIESGVPAQPSVTRPASLVAVAHEAGKSQSTSTIYSTVYKDLSEVTDECMLCQA